MKKKDNTITAVGIDSTSTSEMNALADTEISPKKAEVLMYQPANEKKWDLIHTRLDLSFDYKNRQGIGTAYLYLKPWYYAQETLTLDAKNMEIKSVELLSKNHKITYTSDSLKIYIVFEKEIKDSVQIKIRYISNPYAKKSGGSAAISEDRGLFFINADSSDLFKPTEIWTQGETQSASGWFPTIDSPNEKMTQEINITVDKKLQTISNGKLVKTIQNSDQTKTDCWVQFKPHAPYLAMVAIGPWSVYHDKWRDSIAVDYYMEKEFIAHAKLIFGNTPKMLEVFSNKLGVAYPWDKFSQVVVRDFVSGAMENTSAVVHGEFLNHDARQHLDNSYEDVVSHELFHHWFGDLVTCESWSNLPLNESFATYGEYLWREQQYGLDDAENHRLGYLKRYLSEAETKQEPLIRYIYRDKEDMFDGHSYQKGGLVLYSLRKLVGDEAFYQSLQLYLKRNSFKTVEIHDLRMAFEEVTGRDLNWFFNQFFLTAGHPELSIEKTYNQTAKKLTLNIVQGSNQNYSFPLTIEVWKDGKANQHQLLLKPEVDNYEFNIAEEPDFVNIDPGKNWLCVIKQNNTSAQWKKQFMTCTNFMDQYEALTALKIYINTTKENRQDFLDATIAGLSSEKEGIIIEDLDLIDEIEEFSLLSSFYKDPLIKLIQNSEVATIRNKAILILNKINDPSIKYIYQKAAYDSSYTVLSNALEGLYKYDSILAIDIAEKYINSPNQHLQLAGLSINAAFGSEAYYTIFSTLMNRLSINARAGLITHMGTNLGRVKNLEEAEKILLLFDKESKLTAPWYYPFMIRGNLESAYETQPSETIKALVKKAIDALPAGGSMKMQFR